MMKPRQILASSNPGRGRPLHSGALEEVQYEIPEGNASRKGGNVWG